MFQLKRKSFFNYNVDRFEEYEIQPKIKLPKIQKYDVKHHQQERYLSKENGISRTLEDLILPDFEDEEDEREYEAFEGFSSELETVPKRENKILKLLKFKNKRQNAEDSKVSAETSSENTLNRPEPSQLSQSNGGNSSSYLEESVPVPADSLIPIIKLEPDEPESEFSVPDSPKAPVLPIHSEQLPIQSEQVNNVANENGSPVKSKKQKSSVNAFAKLNPKFIGIGGSYLCTECPYETVYVTHFERHMKLDHPNMTLYKCEICQFETKSKSHLQVHTMNHLGIKPYKCTVCDYASARKDYVNMHMKCHTKDHTYFCPECTYSTYRADYLNRHITDKHLKAIF